MLERRLELCNQLCLAVDAAAAGGTSQSHHDVSRIILEWHHAEKIQQRLFISELTCWLLSSTITAVILLLHFENEDTIYQLASMLGSTHEIANIVPFFCCK